MGPKLMPWCPPVTMPKRVDSCDILDVGGHPFPFWMYALNFLASGTLGLFRGLIRSGWSASLAKAGCPGIVVLARSIKQRSCSLVPPQT